MQKNEIQISLDVIRQDAIEYRAFIYVLRQLKFCIKRKGPEIFWFANEYDEDENIGEKELINKYKDMIKQIESESGLINNIVQKYYGNIFEMVEKYGPDSNESMELLKIPHLFLLNVFMQNYLDDISLKHVEETYLEDGELKYRNTNGKVETLYTCSNIFLVKVKKINEDLEAMKLAYMNEVIKKNNKKYKKYKFDNDGYYIDELGNDVFTPENKRAFSMLLVNNINEILKMLKEIANGK